MSRTFKGARLWRALAVAGVAGLASACGTTFEVANVDPTTGRFAIAKHDEIPAASTKDAEAF